RKYAIRDGAFLLYSALPWMPPGVAVGVVDPGVGTARRPIGLRTGRGDVLIGPDNGLLVPAASALGGLQEARTLTNRDWMLSKISTTFHGRDIFSPMAAHIAIGGDFANVGPAIDPATLVGMEFPRPTVAGDALDTSIIFIASFGNLHLDAAGSDMTAAFGDIEPGTQFQVELVGGSGSTGTGGNASTEHVTWVRTFGDSVPLTPVLYEDSSGRLGYADNQSDAAKRLGAAIDQRVRIRRA
ncbi:MAG: SAM-dependent chlorinase/fluorinase, partial [Chloroflexota bacterium]